jgi:predicted nucleic acid-binding protein
LLGGLPIETDDETDRIHGPVFQLARTHQLTIYDAIYLELASRRGIALATRDRALRRAAMAIDVVLLDA